ncbi:glycosyltransferase family 2 protein [Gluconacetobacter takamatsuzukensis]|uniref:Glycosyltransferase family 2 protein n=2 Tax=Gluconacetobacter takamatsuzukensis TaxID=1286190 RepID=A0A7W4KB37_9PROT|nr:glycosyltransferase family 2 protein [Gluconacetobacter takamatsuzukensis]MBB2203661.1 glycosyltransferase family 2 protein [Gluconacetobacter takamatsuzukensis]
MPVCILLSIHNGARFLEAQLHSLVQQTHADWRLLWRDDGSTDDSTRIMQRFADTQPAGRCIQIVRNAGRLGVAGSFGLLLDQVPDGHLAAFCDQDDVWFPDKLARAALALSPFHAADRPALYCSRQVLTDAALTRIGVSPPLPATPTFPMALTQNIATGCTVMLSPAAIHLVRAALPPPPGTLHDWWSYLLVSGAGGPIVADNQPSLYYRQHRGNAVGAPAHRATRALAALRRGPSLFMSTFRANVAALLRHTDLLTEPAAARLLRLRQALDTPGLAGWLARARLLRQIPEMHRNTRAEQMIFRLWFLLG